METNFCFSYFSNNSEILILGKPINWKDVSSLYRITSILKDKRIESLYLPGASSFTGKIADLCDFTGEHHINGVKIYDGCKTEGIVIPEKTAILITTADCPVIVYHEYKTNLLIAVHAGLGSVIDKNMAIKGESSRDNESVVDEIMKRAKDINICEIFILCGISPNSFVYDITDPVYGLNNQKLFDYLFAHYNDKVVPFGKSHGGISIGNIIKEQFIKYGVDASRIFFDYVDTYEDPQLWSHRRFINGFEDGNVSGRNGILVINKG